MPEAGSDGDSRPVRRDVAVRTAFLGVVCGRRGSGGSLYADFGCGYDRGSVPGRGGADGGIMHGVHDDASGHHHGGQNILRKGRAYPQ